MRLGVKEDFEKTRNMTVAVDGVDVTARCFEADDVEGYTLCYVRNEKGNGIKLTPDKQSLVTERLTGVVTILGKQNE